ncbi:MAG: bifunctional phosphopantothenoylcysteine decarboxylase/phosphopantothenate--cysteine ligase CoaBC [Rhizobium sp.]|nr:bifunctional phosphopantothenoylcysteine decarboxylase/phosphopantothenate--cysteine ligase CoaBC [Rhizobium sp.]
MKGQRILLGVSGGIAAYKAAELVRRLRDAGAEVRVVMTAAALHFVGSTTFQALSGHPVRSSLWDEAAEAAMGHIELARWATRVLVAPASANTLARLAQGRANDLLSTLCLATEAPLLVAPAMNRVMWAHPATQANVATLQARGVEILGPASGDQACGEVGAGRLLEPGQIVAAVEASLLPPRLAGRRILVSAGPTLEDIDPVRFIGNRSSGKMGFAVADAARRMGAEVTLVAGPVSLPTPPGVTRVDVRRAAQMRDAVLAALPGMDAYIGAAAVADYAPAETLPQKLKKSGDSLAVTLVRTADILADVAAHAARPRLVVGFAAETQDLEAYARDKLHRKGLDLIAANDVSRAGHGFEGDDNALSVFWREGRHDIAHGPKTRVARELLQLVADRLEAME